MTPRTIYTDPQWIDSVSLWLVNEETWVDGVCVVTVRLWALSEEAAKDWLFSVPFENRNKQPKTEQ